MTILNQLNRLPKPGDRIEITVQSVGGDKKIVTSMKTVGTSDFNPSSCERNCSICDHARKAVSSKAVGYVGCEVLTMRDKSIHAFGLQNATPLAEGYIYGRRRNTDMREFEPDVAPFGYYSMAYGILVNEKSNCNHWQLNTTINNSEISNNI